MYKKGLWFTTSYHKPIIINISYTFSNLSFSSSIYFIWIKLHFTTHIGFRVKYVMRKRVGWYHVVTLSFQSWTILRSLWCWLHCLQRVIMKPCVSLQLCFPLIWFNINSPLRVIKLFSNKYVYLFTYLKVQLWVAY